MKLLINKHVGENATDMALNHLIHKRGIGAPAIGMYCGYAPVELVRAMGAVPVFLCAFSGKTIPEAETVLPSNLCPLIKSSYGFIKTDTCPFYALSQAIIGETTCDGKKKMFELIQHIKPTHIMDLPQLADEPEALEAWTVMVHKLKSFLEQTFGVQITNDGIEKEIKETNRKNRFMNKLFSYAEHFPPLISWREMQEVIGLDLVSSSEELRLMLDGITGTLNERLDKGEFIGTARSPRVLVSGCPVGGDALKIFNIIEEAGGVIVAMEACSGMKGYSIVIEEDTDDPVAALAQAYLKIPCSCMTPNQKRFDALDEMIQRFKPHALIDVILQACHSYNIESFRIQQHVTVNHSLPFLKVETDFSESDRERLRTRVEAFLESL